MKESERLQFIYDRLINVHKEDPNVDYMVLLADSIQQTLNREKLFDDYMKFLNSKK